jgi:drug/metabolite transporter (DMT)-like permease
MLPTIVISLFGIFAAISWGTADYFAAKASRRLSPEAVALWVSLIGVIAFAIIYLIFPGSFSWTGTGVLYAVAAGVSLELGLFMLFRGLDAGPVSIVSPISSAYPLVSLLILLVVFGGTIRPIEIVGILITVIGVVIASGLADIRKSETKLTAGVWYSIAAFLLWGLAYAMLGKSVSLIGWQKSALVDTCAGFIALTVVLALISIKDPEQRLGKLFKSKAYTDKYVLGTAIVQLCGGIIFTVGLAHARSSAVITRGKAFG